MASAKKSQKHKCSCGRTFRHAISLKRHRNVAGCEEVVSEVAAETVTEACQPEAPAPTDTKITAEQIASWQAQTGFQKRPEAVAPVTNTPKIDWNLVLRNAESLIDSLHSLRADLAQGISSAIIIGGRFALFAAVLVSFGWVLLRGGSLLPASGTQNNPGADRIAAQTVVENFLQTAQLNQYQRAMEFIAPSARRSITAYQLETMFNGLPLDQSPESCVAQLSDDGSKAQVVITRAGADETYTLVSDCHGWGLASVSVTRS